MTLRSFKLNRVYLDPLNMLNVGDFSCKWILKDFIQAQKDEGKFVVVCPRPPCTKKRDVRAELLFLSLNLLIFWSRRCGRRRGY